MPQINEYDKTRLPKSMKLAWFFEADLENDWLGALPAHIRKLGEKRSREYGASRKALALACDMKSMDQLIITDNLHLKNNPKLKVSLSHTRGISAAVASSQLLSVGVDIEHLDRKFKPEIAKFFKRDEDIQMDLIKLWSVKEAAFKALDPLKFRSNEKEVLVLKDLVVKQEHIEIDYKTVASWDCQKHDGIITSVAWVKPLS